MARKPILIEDMHAHETYHRVEPSFFAAPISGCAKGVYLILTSLGHTRSHTFAELASMCADPEQDVRAALDELDRAGFDTSNILRA